MFRKLTFFVIWLSINYIRWNFSKIWSRFWTEGGAWGITFIIPNNCLKNFPPSVGCRHIVAVRIWLLTLWPPLHPRLPGSLKPWLPSPPTPLSQVKHSWYRGVILSHGARISQERKPSFLCCRPTSMRTGRVYAQTTCNPENQGFCFQLCTVAHFIGILLLPWFSCSLFFLPNWIRFSGFCLLCMEKILICIFYMTYFYYILCYVLLISWMSYSIYRTSTRKEKDKMFRIGPHFRCKQIQENQAIT